MSSREPAELTKEVMELFNVDEKTAIRIIAWADNFAQKKLEKWRNNILKSMEELEKKRELERKGEDNAAGSN